MMKKLFGIVFMLMLAVALMLPAGAADGVVMTVNGTEYTDHGTGWSAAVKLADGGTKTTVVLHADWIADSATGFVCPDGGTKDGALYLGDGNLTLNLNGYTIDRNAPDNATNACVFYVENCTLTMNSTVNASATGKNGKITGGISSGNGGGIYASNCRLTIDGGNITGNKTTGNGGGIYAVDCTLTFNSGVIEDNYAYGEGGGLYVSDCTLLLNHSRISGNSAPKGHGGGIYFYDSDFTMNSGTISDNEAAYGGGICFCSTDSTMNGGTISGNTATKYGGGVCMIKEYASIKFTLNGGVIEDNYSYGEGGGLYVCADNDVRMTGGVFRNNTARSHGGAISFERITSDLDGYSTMSITGGEITGNKSEVGHGGGFYWNQNSYLILANCTITGNSAPKGHGGGVHITRHDRALLLGGTVTITDNTANSDSADTTSNVFFARGARIAICQPLGYVPLNYSSSDIDIPYLPFQSGSKIGLSVEAVASDEALTAQNDSRFTQGMAACFFSDNPYYTLKQKKEGSYYHLYLEENPSPTGEPVMRVQPSQGEAKEFLFRKDAWFYALEQSKTNDVTVTLLSDWVAPAGAFDYWRTEGGEYGTSSGALFVGNDTKFNITMDLNGHTIDRGLTVPTVKGYVIYMDTTGSLTIQDSKGGGKITGGNTKNNTNIDLGGGGGIYVDYGTLYLEGGEITDNKAKNGAGIFCNDLDDAIVYVRGGKITGNTADEGGGGIYMYNGHLFVEGGEITGNNAQDGAGVYWESRNGAYFVSGKISGNVATNHGGGVYAENWGKIYLGGDTVIDENTKNNLYLSSKGVKIYNAAGQNGSPNKPLTEGADIHITAAETENIISGDNSFFGEYDFHYIHPDSSSYYIRAAYDAEGGNHAHKLYLNTWSHADARYPRVKAVSVKNSALLESATIDFDAQIITLTAHNTKKNFFAEIDLYNLINYTPDADRYYINNAGETRNMLQEQIYKVMSDNGTYVLCKVRVVPAGGAWAESQDPLGDLFKVLVISGETRTLYTDFGEGWVAALQASTTAPTTLVLNADWTAMDGNFSYSAGTNSGRLYLNDANIDLTIDLNGHTIDRGLVAARSDGQIFKIDNGKLTITDSVGTGKITGACNNGNGGAFLVEYGSLYIKGGTITRNAAKYGAAIYCDDLDDALIYIQGGKITGNVATENGGGIYVYNGYLTVEGGEISGNTAKNGSAIYWESRNAAYLIGGKIVGNNTSNKAGVYVEDYGKIYLGGDIIIDDNAQGNLFLSDEDVKIYNAAGQNGAPNKPLTADAEIGITTTRAEIIISGDNSFFGERDFDQLQADSSSYYIRSVYDANGGNHAHKLYLNTWSHADSRYPRVKTVALKDSDLLESVTLDYDAQIITLTAHNTKKAAFEAVFPYDLFTYTCDKNTTYIYAMEKMCNLFETTDFKVMSDNGTYVLCSIKVVPSGGAWAESQDPTASPYRMHVQSGDTVNGYLDFGEGWAAAIKMSKTAPTTIILNADWTAKDGNFSATAGTDSGRLYLDDEDIDLTIDLNGHTIDRGLTTAVENGSVFYVEEGTLTITDSVGTGKITGGNTTGYGGGILVYDATLYFKGGILIGNKAVDGAGIACSEFAEAFIYIQGGKITGNTASSRGGGIYLGSGPNIESGYLYVEGGEITENSAPSGGGIFWYSRCAAYLTGGKITGNHSSIGGGVYAMTYGKVYLGGDVQIIDNEGYNVYLMPRLYNACGQNGAPNKPLTAGANIGVFSNYSQLTEEGSMFGFDALNYIHSDDPEYTVQMAYNPEIENDPYQLRFAKTAKYMDVTIDGETTSYSEFNSAWTEAIDAAEGGTPVLVTLQKDWYPNWGQNYSYSSGTENGYLHLDDADIDLTIDLNGYSINRGLYSPIADGLIFKIDDGTLTIVDYVGTGKITGANNTGNGGAFLVEYGTLNIGGGIITGNKAENGAAIYCDDLDDAYINVDGGKISGNTAEEGGGGIYVYNGYLTVEGGEISGNTAKKGGGIYWESRNAAYLIGGEITGNTAEEGGVYVEDYGKIYLGGELVIDRNAGGNLYLSDEDIRIYNAAGQSNSIPNAPLTIGANIGITAMDTNVLLSGDNSMFDEFNHKFLHADDSSYIIKIVYDAADNDHHYKLYYSNCVDANGDHICDDCGDFLSTVVNLIGYDSQTKSATVFVPAAGTYTLIFADYEGKALRHMDMVEFAFTAGLNTVSQEVETFTLDSGDKVMLMQNLIPVCTALNLE